MAAAAPAPTIIGGTVLPAMPPMSPTSETFATLVGGLGLLLLGLPLLADGLMLVLGRRVEQRLARPPRSALHACVTGWLASALLPGPSLVARNTTVQLDAGRLTFARATWRLAGGVSGGTAIVVVVAVLLGWGPQPVGLDVLGVPLVAVGALLRAANAGRPAGAVGEAVAGFGLVCVAVALLFNGFVALQSPVGGGVRIGITLAVLGTLLAVMLPVAHAPTLLALVAVQSGLLSVTGGACVVVGAHIGLAMTTLLSLVGLSPNARRVASLQAAAAGVAAVGGLALLPVFAWATGGTGGAGLLAAFVVGIALLPLAVYATLTDGAAARGLAWLPAGDDTLGPAPMDESLLATPPVAVEAHAREVERLVVTTRRLLRGALDGQPAEALRADRRQAEALDVSADRLAEALHRTRLDATLARQLGRTRRCQHDQRASLRQAMAGAAWSGPMRQLPDAASSCSDFTARAHRLLDALDADRDPVTIAERLAETRAAGEATRLGLVTSAAAGAIDIDPMAATLRWHAAMQFALDLQALSGRRPAPATHDAPEATQPGALTDAGETLPST